MSYVKQDEHRPNRRVVDLARFVADLVKKLGKDAKLIAEEHGRSSIEYGRYRITVDTIWNDGTKVALHIREHDWKWLGGDEPTGDGYRFPSIRVSVDRPMEKLVADIVRRLITPAAAVADKRKEHKAKIETTASSLVTEADKLRKKFPNLNVRVDKDAVHSGGLYYHTDGTYLSGRLNANGSVNIDRIGTLSAEQFERVMAVLYK